MPKRLRKNITFPTDVKLHRKIATECVRISKAEGIALRQSYSRTVKHLVYLQRERNYIRTKKRALNIAKNQYDGHTLTAALRQIEELRGSRPTAAITDQRYRRRKNYGETVIFNARDLRRQKTAYGKRKVKKQLRQ
jgi:hypothetical protein